ncbi:hypothetical protein ABJI51_03280 [Amycolatopsis sp. NEAU-NG30]|uniref:Uncharacterized protein n=1 Tax=Amycolatopsis melonis TaxID=3156488 RepID=A0ABV0L9S9_9PSEU
MNKVEAFAANAELERLTLVDASPVVACTVDVAEGAALGFAWIARAAQRAATAGGRHATATRDIGFHPGRPALTATSPGTGLTSAQLIDLLA